MRERWPEWTRDRSELWEPLRAFTRASILEELTALTRGLPEQCPSVDSEGARRTAQAGAPLGLMLTGYRVGHLVQWQAWLDLVWECEQDDGTRRALLGHGSNFFFAYAEMLEDMVTAEFTRERDQLLRGREQRRVHLVRELLDGREVDAGGLNYPLEGRIHLGLVVRGPGAANAVHELARRLGRAVLVVEIAGETWWAWIGGAHALDAAAEDVVSRFRPPAGVRIAVGAPHAGPAGFRRSYREASAAQRAALATNAPVTRYQDVALEVLAAGDEDAARAFVERELAGLEGSDARSHRLVETLTAYFEHDQNAAATAAALGVHEQTVANRLRAVEDRIGRPVAGRRVELETALRLQRYLDAALLPRSRAR